jgi:glycosyltransferase involved in cell wall biosynthesis
VIVIATHNGEASLIRLLQSIMAHGTGNDKTQIGIVVSGGSTPEYKERVKQLARDYNCKWAVDVNDGFESGAWITAYRTWDAETYLFLQDSVEVLHGAWYNMFVQNAGNLDAFCVPWITFEPYMLGVTPDVGQRIITTFGLYDEPGMGIFGSMFYTSRRAMSLLENTGYFNYIPKDKIDSEAAERWWALFFNRLKIPIMPVHPNGYHHIHATGAGWPEMRKHYHTRNGGSR